MHMHINASLTSLRVANFADLFEKIAAYHSLFDPLRNLGDGNMRAVKQRHINA
jgi:hypothetical protein